LINNPPFISKKSISADSQLVIPIHPQLGKGNEAGAWL